MRRHGEIGLSEMKKRRLESAAASTYSATRLYLRDLLDVLSGRRCHCLYGRGGEGSATATRSQAILGVSGGEQQGGDRGRELTGKGESVRFEIREGALNSA